MKNQQIPAHPGKNGRVFSPTNDKLKDGKHPTNTR